MAPVEHALHNSNTQAILSFSAQATVVSYLTYVVISSIRRAGRSLPPSLETRTRQLKRTNDIRIFSVFATLSFGVLSYFAVYRRVLSYQTWAHEHNEVPGALWTGWYASESSTEKEVQLGKWLEDINLGKEWTDLALGTSKGLWWSSAYFTGLTAWSIFLGIEARLKNIPLQTTVSLLLLASWTGLSFAQNLFAILLLLTPVPLAAPPSTGTQRTASWSPPPIALAFFAILSVLSNLLLPKVTQVLPPGSPGLYIASAYPLLFAVLVQKIPLNWGTTHKDSHAAKRSYTVVFSAVSIISSLLYVFLTVIALFENTPDARLNRYNFILNLQGKEEQTTLQRVGVSISTVLGVLHRNPTIGGIAWDVLLSAATLTTWASARDLHPVAILKNSVAPWIPFAHAADEDQHDTIKVSSKKTVPKLEPTVNAVEAPQPSPAKRGRGRSSKNTATQPETTAASRSIRRSTRRQTRPVENGDEDEHDHDYVAPAKTQALVNSTAHEEEREESLAEEAEAAALGWGLFIVGGLGAVTAGTLGAEVTGR